MNRMTFQTMAYHALAATAFLTMAACQSEAPSESQVLHEIRETQQALLKEIKQVKIAINSMSRRGLTINMEPQGGTRTGKGRFDTAESPRLGPEGARIEVVEFADFECPYCKRSAGFGKKLVEDFPGEVAVVFKHFPLRRHENARYAAQASWAAGRQGKFWEFHDAMFAAPTPSKEQARSVAESIGLDMAQFEKDVASPFSRAAVQKDRREGKENEVRGTPTFFVNGELVRGDAKLVRAKVARAVGAGTAQNVGGA
ncbi:MAG: hypothetical protein FJ144_11295, partial [Deltaproteobacteria bacterium]|nr:hypothetical protein [Deltaproteobacteria bacterium]